MDSDPAPGLRVRELAVATLSACLGKRITIDEALALQPDVARLPPRDRAFLLTLILTTLRRKGEAEAIAAKFLAKPLPKRAGATAMILTLAIAQLLYLDQPPHAVIDLAVRQAKNDLGGRHFAGLVNALLRRVAEQGAALVSADAASQLDTPDWLWQRWRKNYGEEGTRAIAAAHLLPPPLDITPKADPAGWAERLGGTLLPTGSIRLPGPGGAVDLLPGFAEGAWWVQDVAAALPARLLGDIAGKRVLDLCAAPGGKTLQLAAAGATVTAVDLSAHRLERLHENLRRTGLTADVVVADALSFNPGESFDAVLLDAPCSATGTIRRHPELPHIRDGGEISRLVPLQRRLLAHAATLVRPGGVLVYCTCSLEPAEGERQFTAFQAAQPSFEPLPVMPGEAGIPAYMIDPEGNLRTRPDQVIGGMAGLDGFFAMRLRRQS